MHDTETAYAKINLALHVRARRADGYHELETMFAFAEDGDVLEADEADALTLALSGPFAAALSDGENLVTRAARALADAAGVKPVAALRLDKRLPVASGIGGGSADAAAALRLLDRIWGTHAAHEDLFAIAARLGSDVPACLASIMARGEGRGERLMPVEDEGLSGTPLLLVNPGLPLSTGAVFAAWDRVDRGPMGDDILAGRNDLEQPARTLVPVIGEVIDRLEGVSGLRLARMSGSGATCFALFLDPATRDAAHRAIVAERPNWWCFASRLR